jgi:hypothetical protein
VPTSGGRSRLTTPVPPGSPSLPFRHINLATGTVLTLSESTVEVSLSRPLRLPLLGDFPFQGEEGGGVRLAYQEG